MSRVIEIFTAECPLCQDALEQVKQAACPSCEVKVVSTRTEAGAARAKEVGIKSVPAVTINGALADCCDRGGVDIQVLKKLGLGQPS